MAAPWHNRPRYETMTGLEFYDRFHNNYNSVRKIDKAYIQTGGKRQMSGDVITCHSRGIGSFARNYRGVLDYDAWIMTFVFFKPEEKAFVECPILIDSVISVVYEND